MWTTLARATAWTLASLGVYALAFAIVFAVDLSFVAAETRFERAIQNVAVPSWLDVATAAVVALAFAPLRAPRARVFAVIAACTNLPIARIFGLQWLLAPFSFGPGARPPDPSVAAWETCVTPTSLTLFACMALVSLAAAARGPAATETAVTS